jgi:hypothetical protein
MNEIGLPLMPRLVLDGFMWVFLEASEYWWGRGVWVCSGPLFSPWVMVAIYGVVGKTLVKKNSYVISSINGVIRPS